MTALLSILGLLGVLGSVGAWWYWQAKNAGQKEERLKATEKNLEITKKENARLSNRPRTLDDRLNRLRRWRDYVRKHEDATKR